LKGATENVACVSLSAIGLVVEVSIVLLISLRSLAGLTSQRLLLLPSETVTVVHIKNKDPNTTTRINVRAFNDAILSETS